jgi:hypothetical protein
MFAGEGCQSNPRMQQRLETVEDQLIDINYLILPMILIVLAEGTLSINSVIILDW